MESNISHAPSTSSSDTQCFLAKLAEKVCTQILAALDKNKFKSLCLSYMIENKLLHLTGG